MHLWLRLLLRLLLQEKSFQSFGGIGYLFGWYGVSGFIAMRFRCPMNKPRPMSVQMAPIPAMPIPAYSDAQGGDIIIINTDGLAGMEKFLNSKGCAKDCGCKKIKHDHDHHSHKDHDHHSHKKDKHHEFHADRHAHMPGHAPMAPEAVK